MTRGCCLFFLAYLLCAGAGLSAARTSSNGDACGLSLLAPRLVINTSAGRSVVSQPKDPVDELRYVSVTMQGAVLLNLFAEIEIDPVEDVLLASALKKLKHLLKDLPPSGSEQIAQIDALLSATEDELREKIDMVRLSVDTAIMLKEIPIVDREIYEAMTGAINLLFDRVKKLLGEQSQDNFLTGRGRAESIPSLRKDGNRPSVQRLTEIQVSI